MTNFINTKIILSAAIILAAAGLIVGATFAFFSDTETSNNNLLAAGELDLKVDSEAHYAGMVCANQAEPEAEPIYQWEDAQGNTEAGEDYDGSSTRPELLGTACTGSWEETDLGESNVFFSLTDIKPGDEGENTISLHVYDNDAWGRMVITSDEDSDVDCTEPESESTDPECSVDPESPGDGELREALLFTVWLDQGSTPGFQCGDTEVEVCADTTEGDNIWQEADEPIVISEGTIDVDPLNETYEFADGLEAIYTIEGCTDADGNTEYGECHGLAADGRMVGSTTYYMGVMWTLPDGTGNEVQSDSFTADVTFDALQHRNNPNPVF